MKGLTWDNVDGGIVWPHGAKVVYVKAFEYDDGLANPAGQGAAIVELPDGEVLVAELRVEQFRPAAAPTWVKQRLRAAGRKVD